MWYSVKVSNKKNSNNSSSNHQQKKIKITVQNLNKLHHFYIFSFLKDISLGLRTKLDSNIRSVSKKDIGPFCDAFRVILNCICEGGVVYQFSQVKNRIGPRSVHSLFPNFLRRYEVNFTHTDANIHSQLKISMRHCKYKYYIRFHQRNKRDK